MVGGAHPTRRPNRRCLEHEWMNAGGLSTRDASNLIRPMIQELPVKAMDIVKISPQSLFGRNIGYDFFIQALYIIALIHPGSPFRFFRWKRVS